MRISYTQSGGFAGLVRGCHIDTATLPEPERREVESLVAACGLTGRCEAATPSARDLRRHDLSIERDGDVARLCCDDHCLPEAARPLIAFLADRARPGTPSLPPHSGRQQILRDEADLWGRFVGDVVARWNDGGRDMTLVAPFAYVDPRDVAWEAPAGAVVDGASIPQAFWSFIGGPFSGAFREASVVHDVACEVRARPWRDVHRMFYEACRCGGVERLRATLMYYAVFHFGPRWRIEERPALVAGRPTAARVVVDESPAAPTAAQAAAVVDYFEHHDVAAADVPALVIPGAVSGSGTVTDRGGPER
jgi:hypothetical protein